jgi:hypothetical protein
MSILSKVYAKDPNIVARKIADEMVLVPIRQNVGDLNYMYTLNKVGGRIWELIDGEMTTQQVRDTLVDEYGVAPEQVEADLAEFFGNCEEAKVVSLVNA